MKNIILLNFTFTVLFSLLSSQVMAQSANDASLVVVSSVYLDEVKPDRKVKIEGSGFLVSYGNRMFVFTAAHVSQGTDTEIKWQGQSLKIINRYFDGLADAEILEIQMAPPWPQVINYDGQAFNWTESSLSGRAKWVDANNFVPLNSGVFDPNLIIDNIFAQAKSDNVSCDHYCRVLSAETLVQPGTSGAPLIVRMKNLGSRLQIDARESIYPGAEGSLQLRGMFIKRERFFSRSSFVHVGVLEELLHNYLTGKKLNESNMAFWKLKGFLLSRYQKYDGISESVLVSVAGGNGTSVEGGNGTSVEGGNGTSVEGGNLELIGENSPKSILDKVSSFPENNKRAAFFWVMAMRNHLGQLISYPMWFDMENYLFLGNFMFSLKGDPSKLTDLFNYRLHKDEMGLDIKSDSGNSIFSSLNYVINLKLDVDSEKIYLIIQRDGSVCQNSVCTSRFDPILEAKSDSGRIFILDLRAFMFFDLSKSTSFIFKDPATTSLGEKQYQALFFDEMQRNSRILRIFVRPQILGKTPMTAEQGLATEIIWSLDKQ